LQLRTVSTYPEIVRTKHTSNRLVIWKRKENNCEDDPGDSDDIYNHPLDWPHVENSLVHGLAAEDYICDEWDQESDIVDCNS